jgi:hypothetical protein
VTEPSALQVYEIPAENMPGLMHKLGQLSKKSQRIMGKPITLNVIDEVKTPYMITNAVTHQSIQAIDNDGNLCWDITYKVTIDAENPKINGWTFVATIDHSATAGNVIRVAPNANCEVPAKYRTIGPVCEHCSKIRSRRDTFLLRSDATGEFKQIGRQCIRDFIGYDVEQMVGMAEIVVNAVPSDSDADGDWAGGVANRHYIRVSTYLAHVSALIRAQGWIGRKLASDQGGGATCDTALTNMFPPRGNTTFKRIALTDKDFETAAGAIEWAAKLPGKNVFDHNLSVLAKAGTIEYRSIGIVAWMVPGFFRATERAYASAQRRAAMNLTSSQYVGPIGAKIGTKSGQTIKPFEAILYGFYSFSNQFGPTYIFRFQGDDGNVYIWKASGRESLDLGGADAKNRVRVRISGGTVKKHEEYEGVKQTYLTRCKVEVIAKAEDAA